MSESFRILSSYESVYFSRLPQSGELGQWVYVSIKSSRPQSVESHAEISAGGKTARTQLELMPGIRQYRLFAPVLWPGVRGCTGLLSIEAEGERISSDITVASHRPWKIYVLSDLCLDYTWGYGSDVQCHADDMAVVEAELRAIDATSSQPFPDQNRYNFVVSREVEFYAANHSAEDTEKLFARIRDGHLSLSPFPTMSMSASQGFEEMVRQLYAARQWEQAHGIPARYANHQETPTITWSMASVLAGSGIPYLVMGILPFDTPWTKRLAEPPVYFWEGPDGSRILVRRYNHNYVEGQFLIRDHATIRQTVERRIIPEYEKLGDALPFDAIGLVGCYGDLSFETRNYAQRKCLGIAEYNAQGWEYPRIINASHEVFWKDVQSQLDAGAAVPVFRGDYGTGWEIWLLTLAAQFAGWRRAQEQGPAADRVFAVASRLDPGWRPGHQARIDQSWKALINLSDHAWNGSEGANRALNLSLRRRWVKESNAGFDAVIESGLDAIARRITTPGGEAVAVFNTLGWSRTAPVRLPIAGSSSFSVKETDSGQSVPSQMETIEGSTNLCFEAADVPALGYRTYALSDGRATPGSAAQRGEVLENRFYTVKIDPGTGGISSLRSMLLNREMVDQKSRYRLNQWLYRVRDRDVPIDTVRIAAGARGPVYEEIVITTRGAGIAVESAIRLYANSDRIDIRNVVEKAPTESQEMLHFAFPLDVPGRTYRFEAPGAIIRAGETAHGGEQLPGSGQAYTAVRHFADASNDSFGVTLSQADSGFIQFGHRTETEDPVAPDSSNATLFAIALGNAVNYAEVTRDQGGEARFLFRYSLRAHGPFEPDDAVRFAWEDNNELVARRMTSGTANSLPAGHHGFLELKGDGIILTNTKAAEESPNGLVLRLWNLREKESAAVIRTQGLGEIRSAFRTDLLERRQEELPLRGGEVKMTVPSRGYATALLCFA